MEPIKVFAVFKKKASENEKSPTHSISAKIGEEYMEIGACWTKEGKNGKFLSCKLQNVYVDHTTQDRTKSRAGFAIVDEKTITKSEIIEEDIESPPNDAF